MMRYFLRKNDPLRPVYAADFEAMTWKLAASAFGVIEGSGGAMPDGGARFLSADFEEVWQKPGGAEGEAVFTRDRPAEMPA